MMMTNSNWVFIFKLNGGVVAWKSSKQDTTGDSTMEAEYIATSKTAKEAVWMKNYIQELGVVPSIAEPVVIFCDNNGAIVQAKEPRSYHRSNHILRCYHLLREMVKWEIVRIGDLEANGIGLHNKAHRPSGTTVQQLGRALDGGHEINCLGLGLERSKSRTSRMGIESPVEICIKSRIHWMSDVFHQRQTWDVYVILMSWLTRCQVD
ncbi:UNVERIFIED_CONTAM: hypothetical protein Slati_0203200 [Sesamum latifolium]|uniref:Uncharacterized protein n=1 Tax=Sesamum latifolium TaxID=2727402 RepID=A0AAW2YBS2_9LAMI